MSKLKNKFLKHLGFQETVTEAEFFKLVKEEEFEAVKKIISKFRRFVNIKDQQDNSPLHYAVMNNNLNILELLLFKRNVIINCVNANGQTPLYLASKHEKYEALKLLINAGADVNICTMEKLTALHISVHEPKIVHLLISSGAWINVADFTGDTPLHYAAVEGCLETVCMLLYYNANANWISRDGLTPFMTALLVDRTDIQDVLFEYVDDFNLYYHDEESMLKLAMDTHSPYIPMILERTLKVSSDEFSWCLRNPNEHIFKLVWDKMDYKENHPIDIGNMEILSREYIEKYVNIIIESPNIEFLLKFVTNDSYFYFTAIYGQKQCSIDILTKLTCLLLQHSFRLHLHDIRNIFGWYGYCELIRLLLYMDHLQSPYLISMLMPRLIFDIHTDVQMIKNEFCNQCHYDDINLQRRWANIDYCTKRDIANYLGYCADRRLMKLSNYDLPETVLPSVPKLIELARDKSREYIIKTFNVANVCQYYTSVDNLLVTQICKKVLKFEIKLYQTNL